MSQEENVATLTDDFSSSF